MTDVMASLCGTPAPAEPLSIPACVGQLHPQDRHPTRRNQRGRIFNQQFFKPKKVVYAAEKAKWNDDDKENSTRASRSLASILPREEDHRGVLPDDVLFIRIKASRPSTKG